MHGPSVQAPTKPASTLTGNARTSVRLELGRYDRPPGGNPIPHVPPPKRHPYDQWSPDARALDLVGDKWTLLIVRDLAAGPRRFVELQRVLPGISTEQLRSRLNRMVADGMLTRKRYREVPPRVDYELTERARELMPILGELARWGYEWAWSPPRAVGVGRPRRDLPARSGSRRPARAPPAPSSSWSTEPDGASRATRSRCRSEGVSVEERPAGRRRRPGQRPDRRRGSRRFSPERDRTGLELSGDDRSPTRCSTACRRGRPPRRRPRRRGRLARIAPQSAASA